MHMANIFQRFVASIENIGSYVHAINENLSSLGVAVQQHSSAIRDATKTEDHNKGDQVPVPLPVVAELRVPEAEQTERRKRENRAFGVQIWLASVTTLAFMAAAIYAGIAACQLKATKQQTILLQQQLESSTACVLFRQYRLTWPDHRGYLSTVMDNRGKVACSNIEADLRLTEIELTHAVGRTLPQWSFSVPDLSPSLTLPIERGHYLNEIGPNELDGNNRLPKAIRITGTLKYSNGFENKSEEVCIYVIGAFNARSQGTGITTVTCDSLPPQIAWYTNLLPKAEH
jgi:hypothetical protein